MSNLNIDTGKAKKLAKRLIEMHGQKSWREVAEDFKGVSFGTLNRIARTGGKWIPKNKAILDLLGISKPAPQPKAPLTAEQRRMKRLIAHMARETRDAVLAKG